MSLFLLWGQLVWSLCIKLFVMEHLSQDTGDFDSQQTIIYDPDLYNCNGVPLQSMRTMIRDPLKPTLIEYVDMNIPDNGRIIPDEVPRVLQPLIDNNDPALDDLLKHINLEKLTQVMSQPDNPVPVTEPDCFRKPVLDDHVLSKAFKRLVLYTFWDFWDQFVVTFWSRFWVDMLARIFSFSFQLLRQHLEETSLGFAYIWAVEKYKE